MFADIDHGSKSKRKYKNDVKENGAHFLLNYLNNLLDKKTVESGATTFAMTNGILGSLIRSLENEIDNNGDSVQDSILKLIDHCTEKEFSSEIITVLERTDVSWKIANILSHDKERSAETVSDLLFRLHDKEIDDVKKKFISNIIYHLEFGKIDISEEGVKYLEKMYDLGELNNPEYFVNRLTGNGDVGIFDEGQELLGYFNVRDGLESEEEIVHPDVMEFTVETLFLTKEGETEDQEQEREKYLQEFKKSYFDFYDDEFVTRTGTRFNNLDFKEQGQFLVYYKSANEEQKEGLLNFIAQHKENGLKSFLSLEQDQGMGEVILSIGKQLEDEPEVVDVLFAQYAEMVNGVERKVVEIEKKYSNMFSNVSFDKKRLTKNLLQEATMLLQQSMDGFNGVDDKKNFVDDLIDDLQRIKKLKEQVINNLKLTTEELNKKLFNLCVLTFAVEEYLHDMDRTLDVTWEVANYEIVIEQEKLLDIVKKDVDKYEEIFLHVMKNFFIINGDVDFSKALSYARGVKNKALDAEIEQILDLNNVLRKMFDNLVYQKEDNIEGKTTSAKVMQKYQEIVEQAKKSKREISELFVGEVALSSEDLDKMSDSLLKKAKVLLDDYVAQVTSEEDFDEDELLKKLDNMEINLTFKLSVIKGLAGKVRPEEIKGIDLEVETAGELYLKHKKVIDQLVGIEDEEILLVDSLLKEIFDQFRDESGNKEEFDEIWQMVLMYKENWSQYSEKVRVCLIKGYLNRLREAGEKTRVYKYEEDGKILVFLRIDDIEKGHKYFGSFNAKDNVKGGKVGESLLSTVLAQEGHDSDISAVCAPQEDVLAWYVNKHDFVVNGIELDYEKTGQAFANIERKKERVDFYYKDYSDNNIKREYEKNFLNNNYGLEQYIVLKYTIDDENDESVDMNNEIKQLTTKKYIVSRCFFDKQSDQSKDIYLCFEKS